MNRRMPIPCRGLRKQSLTNGKDMPALRIPYPIPTHLPPLAVAMAAFALWV